MNGNDQTCTNSHIHLQVWFSEPYHTSFYLEMIDQCPKFIYQGVPGRYEIQKDYKSVNCKHSSVSSLFTC